jgi:nicotinamide-nucleotide amidase
MESYYQRRNRVMPPNNKKQAMLPAGAEMIDNPIGTACGFAVTIGKARFMFTPGVPREMRRMLDEQLIPRLLAMSGMKGVTRLKRFHSFGIGESRADQMLEGIPGLEDGGAVKLGFQSHYPQLETKLVVRADDAAALERILGPVETEVRRRLASFIIAEDDQKLEGVILDALAAGGHTLAIAEMVTGGGVAARLAPQVAGGAIFRRGIVARDIAQIADAVGVGASAVASGISEASAIALAEGRRKVSGASHARAVLMDLDEGEDRIELGGTICIGIADPVGSLARPARLLGGREWVRMGTIELALDALRRRLLGLQVDERIDFEKR